MRSSAALLIGVLLVVSVTSGVGAGYPGDDPAHTSSAPAVAPAASSDTPMASSDASTALLDAPATLTDAPNATNTSSNVTSNVTVRDGTEMYVSLHENGNARWNVTARFVLHGENETAAFRELATDYETGNADVGFTRATFERVVEHAASDTDRPMTIQNVTRSGSLRQNGSVGVLSLSFTWTNFTHVEEGQIVLGDAFWVGSQTWLPSLTADQTLVVEAPGGYYVLSSNVAHNGTRVRYDGPHTFDSGDFSITYAPKQTPTTTTTTDPGGFDFSSTSGLVIVLFLFGLGGFGAYAAAQRRGPDPDPVEETESVDASPPATTVADANDGGDDIGDDRDERDARTADEDEDDETPIELLSDEERVLRLLRENDGRMKQAQIVKETNWSNAKVSQLLSKMNDNGDVDKLRIGRENLITHPDEDVTDVD